MTPVCPEQRPSTNMVALSILSIFICLQGVLIRSLFLQDFDWAGWADWHESPLATGVVSLWTQWTAKVVSTAQPFELRPGESFSSALFYLSVVLLLSSLIAQPRQ